MTRLAYTPAEVGERLGYDRKTIIRWINEGVLRGTQIRGRWLVPADAVRELLETGNGAGSGAGNQPHPEESAFASEKEAYEFVQKLYRDSGGVTPELRRAYEAYLRNVNDTN